MKAPTVEEELRTEHRAEEKREELVDTLDELKRRGHVAAEKIEEVSLDEPLVPLAIAGALALAGAVMVGDAIYAMRRGAVRMRRRMRVRKFRRSVVRAVHFW